MITSVVLVETKNTTFYKYMATIQLRYLIKKISIDINRIS